MFRIPRCPLFNTNEYRVLDDDPIDNTSLYITCFSKRSNQPHQRTTHKKYKAGLIKVASSRCRIDLSRSPPQSPQAQENDLDGGRPCCMVLKGEDGEEEEAVDYFSSLPREVLLRVLRHLSAMEVVRVSKTCGRLRRICYDNHLWRSICCNAFSDPSYLSIDLQPIARALRKWYKAISGQRVGCVLALDIYQCNMWRLIYMSLQYLDTIPSIAFGRGFIAQRSIECFPRKRFITYTSTQGSFQLVGVQSVSRVEYVVHDHVLQPWHKKEFEFIRPLPIYELRYYGLKLARTVRGRHNIGFFNRRGYFLKTNLNRKLHLCYRYFPAIRFKLYKQEGKVFLLCQDLNITNNMSSDCYTMYQIIRTATAAEAAAEAAQAAAETAEDDVTTTTTDITDSGAPSPSTSSTTTSTSTTATTTTSTTTVTSSDGSPTASSGSSIVLFQRSGSRGENDVRDDVRDDVGRNNDDVEVDDVENDQQGNENENGPCICENVVSESTDRQEIEQEEQHGSNNTNNNDQHDGLDDENRIESRNG